MHYFSARSPLTGFRVGLLLTIAIACAGCPSDSAPTTAVLSRDSARSASSGLAAPGYHSWRGLLPGTTDSVTLHLIQTGLTPGPAEATTALASYTVSGVGTSQYLYRRRATPDSLVLEEGVDAQSGNSEIPATLWMLARHGAELMGTRAGRPLRLRPGRPPGAVALQPYFFADSVVADRRFKSSARGRVCLLALAPTVGPPALTTAVLGMWQGDSMLNATPAPLLLVQWAKQRREFRDAYRAAVDAAQRADGDSMAVSEAFNHVREQTARIVWNEDGLLSLGQYTYTYWGGLHGYGSTSVGSFNSRTGQRLTYDDLFVVRATEQLKVALDRAARRRYNLAPTAPLGGENGEGPLFVEHIPVTRNVCLTGGGVLFVYPPYALASYADGEIELFVPFRELRGVLRPGLPGLGVGMR
ncbi:MAG: DUF3298 domain-containing protein [Hymenobacteraceae bacterium]|nr:DUF3298 domain-containing protein [Hymenobacteraceae bacterium]